eukprot:scaffold394933_cov139-Cyclotella_meneghiniana.AAC.1
MPADLVRPGRRASTTARKHKGRSELHSRFRTALSSFANWEITSFPIPPLGGEYSRCALATTASYLPCQSWSSSAPMPPCR